ncbi:MAG: uL15 family ribosomal protein [Candidatus Aenigmatarchaeota archaeon]
MVVRFKKKRRRGERTYHGRHGYPRGGGSRGGRGNAGLHKHKWLHTIKYMPDHFGKEGFRNPNKRKIKVISLRELEEKIEEFIKNGYAIEKNGKIEVFLNKAGYDKLISSSIKLSRKYIIHIPHASEKTINKIKSFGSEIIIEK